jgi:hypothetical protein
MILAALACLAGMYLPVYTFTRVDKALEVSRVQNTTSCSTFRITSWGTQRLLELQASAFWIGSYCFALAESSDGPD